MILAIFVGCSDINRDALLLPRDTGEDEGDTGDTAGLPTGGERLLLLNGKLSSIESNYTLNTVDADGDWIGSSLYVYDPGAPGALARLGWLWYGPDDGVHDWETMTAREVAVAPDGTVWVVLIDQGVDDEWLLAKVDVPDPAGTDQELAVTAWAINPLDEALYGAADLTGAGFDADGTLRLGTPADGAFPGTLFGVGPLPPAEDTADPYYAASGLATGADLAGSFGIAGDIALHTGTRFALVRSGTDFGVNTLYDLDAGVVVGDGTSREADEPLTALASVNGALLAVGIEGDLWRIDPETGAFEAADDLAAALPDDDRGQSTRRLRGAATLGAP